MDDLIDEVNHDTITSLRNFVESSQYVKKAVAVVNSSSQSDKGLTSKPSSKASSRSSSFSVAALSETAAGGGGGAGSTDANLLRKTASIHGGEMVADRSASIAAGWRRILPKQLRSNNQV